MKRVISSFQEMTSIAPLKGYAVYVTNWGCKNPERGYLFIDDDIDIDDIDSMTDFYQLDEVLAKASSGRMTLFADADDARAFGIVIEDNNRLSVNGKTCRASVKQKVDWSKKIDVPAEDVRRGNYKIPLGYVLPHENWNYMTGDPE